MSSNGTIDTSGLAAYVDTLVQKDPTNIEDLLLKDT